MSLRDGGEHGIGMGAVTSHRSECEIMERLNQHHSSWRSAHGQGRLGQAAPCFALGAMKGKHEAGKRKAPRGCGSALAREARHRFGDRSPTPESAVEAGAVQPIGGAFISCAWPQYFRLPLGRPTFRPLEASAGLKALRYSPGVMPVCRVKTMTRRDSLL